jgi:hypothetical protein
VNKKLLAVKPKQLIRSLDRDDFIDSLSGMADAPIRTGDPFLTIGAWVANGGKRGTWRA